MADGYVRIKFDDSTQEYSGGVGNLPIFFEKIGSDDSLAGADTNNDGQGSAATQERRARLTEQSSVGSAYSDGYDEILQATDEPEEKLDRRQSSGVPGVTLPDSSFREDDSSPRGKRGVSRDSTPEPLEAKTDGDAPSTLLDAPSSSRKSSAADGAGTGADALHNKLKQQVQDANTIPNSPLLFFTASGAIPVGSIDRSGGGDVDQKVPEMPD